MPKIKHDLTTADRSRIAELVDQFETQHRQHSQPSIEGFLELEPRLREPLLQELLMIEFEASHLKGQSPSQAGYLKRFPGAVEFINQYSLSKSSAVAGNQDEDLATADYAEETVVRKQDQPVGDDETMVRSDPTKPQCDSIDALVDAHSTVDVTGVFHFDAPSTQDDTLEYSAGKNASKNNDLVGHVERNDLPAVNGYAVTREIARGGMGKVLAAHDLTLDREVAIKILLSSSSTDAAARFLTESKITARLPHPGVPPVYELGTLDDGAPFLAMKLVQGKTLGELLRERNGDSPDLNRWVGVFEQICQAVGYAHSQGILHRDLKPANVMVGGFGEVHVMDWGLAKDTQNSATAPHEATSSLVDGSDELSVQSPRLEQAAPLPNMTAAGQVMGTPQYMAPEQARGEVVDARADVFALGGILSVILTGQPPFTGGTTLKVLKNAAAGNLSEAQERLEKCDADIELIDLVRQCLSPDPSDRPADGMKVAEAVKVYRAGVDARLQEAQAQRAAADARAIEQRKRRQVWMVAASIVIGVLIAGGSAASWQWFRAEDALTQVTSEQEKTLEALEDLTASRDRNARNLRLVTKQLVPDLVGRTKKLTESDQSFIRGLLPMWQELANARGDSPEALELRAEGQFSVANLQDNLGQFSEAEAAYRAALAAYEGLSLENSDDPKRQQSVARVHNNLGNVLKSQGDTAGALAELRAALAIQIPIAIEHPDEVEYQRDVAKSYLNMGNQLSDQGKTKEAQKEYQSALEIFDRLSKDHPEETKYLSDLAFVHTNLGNLFHRIGVVPKTLEQYRTAMKLYEELAARFPNEMEYRKNFAGIQTNLGAIFFQAGELKKSEEQYRRALAVREELVSSFPTIAENRSDLVRTHSNLAVLLAAAKKRSEAEKHYSRSLDLLNGLLEQSPNVPEYRALLASTHDNLGLVLGDQERDNRKPIEAEKQHRAALIIWDELQDEFPNNPQFRGEAADCRNHLGLLISKEGRIQEADELYIEAINVREGLLEKFPDNVDYLRSLAGGYCNLGNLVTARDELTEGLKWFDKAATLLEPRVRSEPKDTRARQFLRNSYWSRAGVKDKLGKTSSATTDWEKAIKLSPSREQILLKQMRADSRARAGLAQEAIEIINEIEPLLNWPPSSRYNFACTCAIASEKTDNEDEKQDYADKAMDLLGKAVRDGWKDAEKISNDPDLASLRERDDFKQLLDELTN